MSTTPVGSVLEAAQQGAVLFLAPDRGTIAVTGPERKSWLGGLVTSDLGPVALAAGARSGGIASYGLFLVKVGRILADAWIVDAGDRILVAPPRDRVPALAAHLEQYLLMEDASHDDASTAWTWAHLHGPDAASVAAELGQALGGFAGAFDVTGFGGAFLAVPTGARPPTTATTGGGASDASDATGAAALIAAFGAGSTGRPRRVGSDADWLALRVARGVPAWGVDFGEKHYPQEASLEKLAVSFSKGCYLGQEVVCRLEMRGHVTKKLVVVEMDQAPGVGAEVSSPEGKRLGEISTVALVPGHAATMALAMLRYDATEPGTRIVVAGASGRVIGAPPSLAANPAHV